MPLPAEFTDQLSTTVEWLDAVAKSIANASSVMRSDQISCTVSQRQCCGCKSRGSSSQLFGEVRHVQDQRKPRFTKKSQRRAICEDHEVIHSISTPSLSFSPNVTDVGDMQNGDFVSEYTGHKLNDVWSGMRHLHTVVRIN